MTRCLTDRALTRLLADLGTPTDRAHLAVCAPCTARYRRLQSEISGIAHVLAATHEPRRRTVPAPRRWIAAAAVLATAVAGVWFWMETASWMLVPVRSLQDPVVSTAMTDLTAALFSVDGEPRRRTAPLVPDMTQEAGCETVTQMAGIHCADGLLGLGEGMGAPDLETHGPSAGRAEGQDEGQAEGVSP